MGIILNWNSTYPTAVDDRTTSLPTLTDAVHDVIVSHPNELADAVIFLERENVSYKDNIVMTGCISEFEDRLDAPRVVGGGLFNGAQLAHMIPHFRALGMYNLNGGAAQGTVDILLYDMGPPGTPLLPPVLRSTLSIPNADDGDITKQQKVLTLSASPGVNADVIHNSARVYEVRIEINGGPVGSTAKVHWAGLALGVTQ